MGLRIGGNTTFFDVRDIDPQGRDDDGIPFLLKFALGLEHGEDSSFGLPSLKLGADFDQTLDADLRRELRIYQARRLLCENLTRHGFIAGGG